MKSITFGKNSKRNIPTKITGMNPKASFGNSRRGLH
jgi:hypothetical protein